MVYTGELRELLDESFLIRATVKSPSDIRRLNVTKGNIKKNISRRNRFQMYRPKKFRGAPLHQFVAEHVVETGRG